MDSLNHSFMDFAMQPLSMLYICVYISSISIRKYLILVVYICNTCCAQLTFPVSDISQFCIFCHTFFFLCFAYKYAVIIFLKHIFHICICCTENTFWDEESVEHFSCWLFMLFFCLFKLYALRWNCIILFFFFGCLHGYWFIINIGTVM